MNPKESPDTKLVGGSVMMKTNRILCAVLAGTAILSGAIPAASAERILELTPEDTQVKYELDAGAHLVHGTFVLVSGTVRFDLDAGTAGGEIVVDARSGSSGSEGRDKRMHHKVLESSAYPKIVFTPEAVEGELVEGETHELRLSGKLSIHGQAHPMTLPAEVLLEGDHVTARTQVTIPYVSWGMKDPSVFIFRAKKTAGVSIELEGNLSATNKDATLRASALEPGR
jgi:polyisoprenoid-binding protein YceI